MVFGLLHSRNLSTVKTSLISRFRGQFANVLTAKFSLSIVALLSKGMSLSFPQFMKVLIAKVLIAKLDLQP